MNILLAFIAIIFAASWLPINLFNILSDSRVSIIKAGQTYYITNAICILFAMSSAVSNPFLYGFLNENFKREYVILFSKLFTRILICFNKKTVQTRTRPSVFSKTNEAPVVSKLLKKEQPEIIVTTESQQLLKPRPIILINSESINDVA